jgi:hypothetical protein
VPCCLGPVPPLLCLEAMGGAGPLMGNFGFGAVLDIGHRLPPFADAFFLKPGNFLSRALFRSGSAQPPPISYVQER